MIFFWRLRLLSLFWKNNCYAYIFSEERTILNAEVPSCEPSAYWSVSQILRKVSTRLPQVWAKYWTVSKFTWVCINLYIDNALYIERFQFSVVSNSTAKQFGDKLEVFACIFSFTMYILSPSHLVFLVSSPDCSLPSSLLLFSFLAAAAWVWQAVCSKIQSLQYMFNPLNNGFI